jgi:hypothetical protein
MQVSHIYLNSNERYMLYNPAIKCICDTNYNVCNFKSHKCICNINTKNYCRSITHICTCDNPFVYNCLIVHNCTCNIDPVLCSVNKTLSKEKKVLEHKCICITNNIYKPNILCKIKHDCICDNKDINFYNACNVKFTGLHKCICKKYDSSERLCKSYHPCICPNVNCISTNIHNCICPNELCKTTNHNCICPSENCKTNVHKCQCISLKYNNQICKYKSHKCKCRDDILNNTNICNNDYTSENNHKCICDLQYRLGKVNDYKCKCNINNLYHGGGMHHKCICKYNKKMCKNNSHYLCKCNKLNPFIKKTSYTRIDDSLCFLALSPSYNHLCTCKMYHIYSDKCISKSHLCICDHIVKNSNYITKVKPICLYNHNNTKK